MAQMPQLSDRSFKITMINYVKALVEIADNMQQLQFPI